MTPPHPNYTAGYSATCVFSILEQQLLEVATACVGAAMKLDLDPSRPVRCHELARAVKLELEAYLRSRSSDLPLAVQDGYFGHIDHSWIWLDACPTGEELRPWVSVVHTPHDCSLRAMGYPFPHILDVYSVASLPMVRLIDPQWRAPHGAYYRVTDGWGETRTDIDTARVAALAAAMTVG